MTKRLLSIILSAIMILGLVGCGGDNAEKIIPENKSETNTESINQETLPDNPDKSTNEIKEITESEDTSDEIVAEEVVDKVDENSDTEIKEQVDSKDNTEIEKDEDVIEETKSTIFIAEDSSLVPDTKFNGLYRVNGYSRMQFGSALSFAVELESISGENEGSIDVSKAGLVDNILDFVDYLYFDLTFKDNQIVDWDIVDSQTFESVTSLTEEELINRYFPEVNYELVLAGALPELINLSDYEIGKTYVFDVPSEDNFEPPAIVNDTDYPLLIVSIKNGIEEDFEREYKPKHVAPNTSFSSTYSDDGKYYVAVIEGNSSILMNSDDC